jgi:hypothetical protein
VWDAADRPCGERLAPFLPELVPRLEHHGELTLRGEVRQALVEISAATIERLLATARQRRPRRPYTSRPASETLQALIPVRTFSRAGPSGGWWRRLPGRAGHAQAQGRGSSTSATSKYSTATAPSAK